MKAYKSLVLTAVGWQWLGVVNGRHVPLEYLEEIERYALKNPRSKATPEPTGSPQRENLQSPQLPSTTDL